MTREETFNTICTVLEEYMDQTIEQIAEQLMAVLAITGDDLLDHLDPPVGLKHWLVSHGLSLVVTHSPTPPQVWGILQGEDEEEEEGEIVEGDLEGGLGDVSALQVGGYVEYRTAPAGPRGQSQIGSGHILRFEEDVVVVDTGDRVVGIIPSEGDIIRPSVAPGQSAEVLPS